MANIRIRLDLPCPLKETAAFSLYRVASDSTPDVTLTAEVVETLTESAAPVIYSSAELRIRREESGTVRYYLNPLEHAPWASLQELDPHRLHLRYLQSWQDRLLYSNNFFQKMGFENVLLRHGALLLHASYIETPRGALLFSGPSGIGKSTQAALWEQYTGAQLVNGDRVALRYTDSGVTAWGLPYAGSSSCYRNVTLPVLAIVRLEQAAENTLTRLSPAAAFRYLYEQTTVNTWDEEMVRLAAMRVGKVCENAPVYHYACTKGGDAVEMLRTALHL